MNAPLHGTRRWPDLVPVVIALVAWSTSMFPPHARAGEVVAQAGDPLAAMNEVFRAAYQRARSETMARLGPVLLVRHDQLILQRGAERREATVIPPQYHQLKAVAHVPLAIFVLLTPWEEGPIDEARLGELRHLREAIIAACPAVETCGFRESQRARQRTLIRRSLTYLDSVLAQRSYRRDELEAFTRSTGPLVLANAAEAAALQIDAYHQQVSAWRRTLTPDQWDRLRVVVISRQLPRKGNVAVQYFARLLGVPGEGPRLVYAEELSGDQGALDLLGTHLLDREIGRAFFDDPARMERDLLGDGAAEYLKDRDVRAER